MRCLKLLDKGSPIACADAVCGDGGFGDGGFGDGVDVSWRTGMKVEVGEAIDTCSRINQGASGGL